MRLWNIWHGIQYNSFRNYFSKSGLCCSKWIWLPFGNELYECWDEVMEDALPSSYEMLRSCVGAAEGGACGNGECCCGEVAATTCACVCCPDSLIWCSEEAVLLSRLWAPLTSSNCCWTSSASSCSAVPPLLFVPPNRRPPRCEGILDGGWSLCDLSLGCGGFTGTSEMRSSFNNLLRSLAMDTRRFSWWWKRQSLTMEKVSSVTQTLKDNQMPNWATDICR